MANNEKVSGPHSGILGVVSVLLLTAFTWGLLFFLHTRFYHDPIDPLSPNEHSTSVRYRRAGIFKGPPSDGPFLLRDTVTAVRATG